MISSPANYIPQHIASGYSRQAWRVWAVAVAIVLAWVLAIVSAPIFLAAGHGQISTPIYHFFSFICHQIPERSLHLEGHQFAVCSRCFGVYFGLLAGLLAYPLWRSITETEPLPRIWLFLSLIPIGVDWSLGVFGIWENTHLSRFITGTILGVACATFIVPALVETARNLAAKRRTTKS
jgi:uncharacterized membrane protein